MKILICILVCVAFVCAVITQTTRQEAERKLKAEEMAQSAANRQILSGIKAVKDFEAKRKQAAFDREFYGY